RWAQARAAPWYAQRVELLAHAGLADWSSPRVREEFLWAEMRPTGWSPFYPAEWPAGLREQRFGAARAACTGVLSGFRVNPLVARIQRDLLAACRARG